MTAATMPREWVRGPQWASEQARAEWEPVLRSAQAAWSELELASVTEHLRGSALVHLAAGELVKASRDCAGQGLVLTILGEQLGGTYRAAVHWPGPLAGQWHRAWEVRDGEAIGRMLGFPACCRAFFARTWGAGSPDPTPDMATVSGPWEANTLLRWLGVRLVPHLPCSASCEATVAQARAFLEVGRRIGADVTSLEELLRLPASYSAVNGVAIVETPHFRFMAGAGRDAQLAREASVDGGPPPQQRLAILHGQELVIPAAPPAWPPAWEDNGFASEAAMRAAHAVVLAALRVSGLMAGRGRVLDLGAGDGSLLEAIRQAWPGSRCVGIEVDEGRAMRGIIRHPDVELRRGRIEDLQAEGQWDLVLLMPGRLLEMGQAEAYEVREVIQRGARRLVLYAYGDWIEGGLRGLAARAGLRVIGPVTSVAGVTAQAGVGVIA